MICKSYPLVSSQITPILDIFEELHTFSEEQATADILYILYVPKVSYGNRFKEELVSYSRGKKNKYLVYSSFLISTSFAVVESIINLHRYGPEVICVISLDGDQLYSDDVSCLLKADSVFCYNFPKITYETKTEFLNSSRFISQVAKLFKKEITFPHYTCTQYFKLLNKRKELNHAQASGLSYYLLPKLKFKLY